VNADTTWLLQIPLPSSSSNSPRRWHNILLDPWLSGSQSDVASWFSRQWHSIAPALGSIAEVEELCREVEAASISTSTSSNDIPPTSTSSPPTTLIDTIAISHEFTDHCHKATLLECSPSTKVIAATKAASLVEGWKHFDSVIETPIFNGDWRETGGQSTPPWLNVSRLQTKSDALYYHSAILIAWGDGTDGDAEAVIYTPHGIHAPSLEAVSSAKPPIQTLAFLHGLHDVSIDYGLQLNLGAHNGLTAQKVLGAKYWIGTHDEVKKGGGLVSWFLRRKVYTVKDALEKAKEETGGAEVEARFLELKNGESEVLA